MKKIHIPPLGWLARLGDWLMTPVMYLLSGTFKESPQRTHCWNKRDLTRRELLSLDKTRTVRCAGILTECSRYFLKFPLFHMPIFGGWRHYVVLEPYGNHTTWHVGWITEDSAGVTRLTLRGPVRMLVGPKMVTFFGINAEGKQISLVKVAEGTIGSGYLRTDIPLL